MRLPSLLKFFLLLITAAVLSFSISTLSMVFPLTTLAQSHEVLQQRADQFLQEGVGRYESSQFSEALDSWQSALKIYREIGDRAAEGVVSGYLCTAHEILSKYDEAIVFYNRQLEISRELSNQNQEVAALNGLGITYGKLGEYAQAITLHEQQLDIAQELFDREGEAAAFGNLGVVYSNQGSYQKAIEIYNRQLNIAREISNQKLEADAVGNLGVAYRRSGQYKQAIEYSETQLSISRELDDLLSEVRALGNLGIVYRNLGNYEKSQELHEEQLEIARRIGDLLGESRTLNNLGTLYRDRGEYARAIELYTQQQQISLDINDQLGESRALGDLATTYRILGEYERALELFNNQLMISQGVGDRAGESAAFGGLGVTYYKLEEYTRAMDLYEKQLEVTRQIENRAREGRTLGNLGVVYAKLGKHQQAIGLYKEQLNISQEIGDRASEGIALGNLGVAYEALGEYELAISFAQQGFSIGSAIESPAIEWNFLRAIGRTLAAQGQPELGTVFYKKAVNVIEEIRQSIRTLPVFEQESYTGTITDTYRELAKLLLAQGRISEAQQVIELLKVQELREFTRATWTTEGLVYDPLEEDVFGNYEELVKLGLEIYACEQTGCSSLNELLNKSRAVERLYDTSVLMLKEVVKEKRQPDDQYYHPDKLTSDALDLVNEQPGTILIYPVVLEQELLLIWTATGGIASSISVKDSQGNDITLARLSSKVQRFREQLDAPYQYELSELQATARELYGWIVEPLSDVLKEHRISNIIFAQDRVTRYLPMPALHDGENYLVEKYTIHTVLSAALTNAEDRLGTVEESSILGLGLTEGRAGYEALPKVEEELHAIVKSGDNPTGIYPGKVFLDEEFTFEALAQNLRGSRILHIATHAEFVPVLEGESYLLLGDGSPLKVASPDPSINDIDSLDTALRDINPTC